MAERLPGDGFLGWLGRQIGYVKKAVRTDVGGEKVVYRETAVQEEAHPGQPGVMLRRTTTDEVVVKEEERRPEL